MLGCAVFEVVTLAKAGELKPETRRAVIRANLALLRAGARELVKVLPEMSQVDRNMMRLAFCEAIAELDAFEDRLGAVRRVVNAAATA